MAGAGAIPSLQPGLLPGTEVVSLVGFRQWHDERPRFALERPAVLGAETSGAADDRGGRAAAASRDRAGLDARQLRVWRARRMAAGAVDLASGRGQAGDLDRWRNPEVGQRRALHRHEWAQVALQLRQASAAAGERFY